MSDFKYKRILLKLSGEVLAGSKGTGIDSVTVAKMATSISKLVKNGLELGIVVGGGNFWRGRSSENMDRVTADHMGMLATCINALALSDSLKQQGCDTRVMSAIEMHQIAETYIRLRAIRHLEKGRVLIFACGTGNPYFSTDSAAALRAAEINAEAVFKATNVDGVYNKDPKKFPDAKKYDVISHDEVLQKHLAVMDSTAAALCNDNNMDIYVFNVNNPDNIEKILNGEPIGTLVK